MVLVHRLVGPPWVDPMARSDVVGPPAPVHSHHTYILLQSATHSSTSGRLATCRCRECHPWPATSTLTPGPERGEHPAMTLSYLYLAFCRALQLIRLVGRSDTDLAVEIVMLRHEVAVLRRQVHRPALEPADRAVLSGLARQLPRRRLGGFFVRPETPLRWHRDLVAKRWTYAHGSPVDRLSRRGPRPWCANSRRRTQPGATVAFTPNWPPWGSSSPPPASGRS